ncbi:Hypothetical_protein [Hexamita inflata]|uniref:Hypothetical_protein n=1 Tax=Hexamita inflata TaxID=28002 RepID=A0ABP1IK58_9EUKA
MTATTSQYFAQYYGLMYTFDVNYLLLIKDAQIYYNITSTDIFVGITQQTKYITMVRLFIQNNVTSSVKNFGISYQLNNSIFTDVELTGQIVNGQQWIRGISELLGGYFQIQNMTYSLQLDNIVSSACNALVKNMAGASSVVINNIIFEGYARLNAISFSYIKGSNQCITGSQTVGRDGMCYCYDTATPQIVNSARVCKCPGSQTLKSNKCV